jgi:glycosyltransferase involved in cell wall biosynthesis
MKLAAATFHVPHPEGTAAGRQLWALAEAWRADGHEVTAWCWGPDGASLPLPEWCTWEPQQLHAGAAAHLRAAFRPRWAPPAGRWRAPEDAVLWADDWTSWPAVASAADRAVVTVHYDVGLDARALGGWSPPLVQDWRAQRRAVRGAAAVFALSDRVGAVAGARAVLPATLPMPERPLPLVDEPRVLLLANWTWPANQVALRQLLADWDDVRARVPGAELLVAGRGSADVGTVAGVRVLGAVPRAVDAMAQAAVFAFPCPPTSGPKMKVLDACAAGVPVVTTAGGAEGLRMPPDAVLVTSPDGVRDGLVELLRDPSRRAAMATAARAAAVEGHAPAVAARERAAALSAAGLGAAGLGAAGP